MSASVMPEMVTVRSLLRRRFPQGRSCSTLPWPGQSMVSVPPRACTSTWASSQPSRMPATTAAQAPVPQASVSPAPRSYTRSRMRLRDTTCMKPALTLCGKRECCSTRGPMLSTCAMSTSSTRCTACGLPIESTATSPTSSGHSSKPPTRRGTRPAGSNGTRAGSKTGGPMSTVTRPSGCRRSSSSEFIVSTFTVVLSVRPRSCT